MNRPLNETHDPRARSWVESANAPDTDFPLQNLPFGPFCGPAKGCEAQGVAIGDQVLDLGAAADEGLLHGLDEAALQACQDPCLNSIMGLGRPRWQALRLAVFRLLREDFPDRERAARLLQPLCSVKPTIAVAIGDYTDFYASIHHASNVGALFRPDNPLLPNYKWVPIGYHGRASSIVPTGTPIRRPKGQRKSPEAPVPEFGPARRLDYELEVGAFIGTGNELGLPIPISDVREHLFGLALVNDWSARDLQTWEYQPLGPFLAKNFATTVSPWIVTAEALEPYRIAAATRPQGDPEPLPYLNDPADQSSGGFDIRLEVLLTTAKMRESNAAPYRVSSGSFRDMYWTFGQMIAHHTSNGCDLRPGDLLASGTVSGPEPSARGCLLEMTRGGAEPIQLPSGEQRTFLEDGDEVIIRGYCQREGFARIGFGECRGMITG